jgi:MFS family permease
LVYGGLLYAVGFGLPGFVDKVPFLFASVFVLTVGEIVVTTSTMPFIANHTPASHRGRMSAVLPMIMGLGYTVGPSITGNVSNNIGINSTWRIVGLIMVTFTALAYLLEKYDIKTTEQKDVIAVSE